jgi:hypothetical protein
VTTAEHQVMELYSVKDLLESQVEDQGKVKVKLEYYRTLKKGIAPSPEEEEAGKMAV